MFVDTTTVSGPCSSKPVQETDEWTDIGRNFDTATVGIENKGILAFAKLLKKYIAYEPSIAWARATFNGLYRSNDHGFFFDVSATACIGDILRQCFPDIGRTKTSIASQHEYYGFIDMLSRGDSEKVAIFDIYHQNGTLKNYADLSADILSMMNENVELILLSSLTRFCEMPCCPPNKKSNIAEIEALRRSIKAAWPNVAFIVDSCQAVGRMEPDYLDTLQADVLIGCGHKVIGVENVAFMAISKEFNNSLPPERRFREIPCTKPLTQIIAMTAVLWMIHLQVGWTVTEFRETMLGETRYIKARIYEFGLPVAVAQAVSRDL